MDNFTDSGKFNAEIISKGFFMDNCDGKLFKIKTTTFRVTGVTLNASWSAQALNDPQCYETHEEYVTYREKKAEAAKRWEQEIKSLLGLEENTVIAHVESEVFATFYCYKI